MLSFFKIFVPIFTLLLYSCSAEPAKISPLKSASNDSLYVLVVAQHDSVMPKTSLMEAQQRQLRQLLDSDKTANKDSILAALSTLQKGQDAMMAWMNEFKNTEVDIEHYTPLTDVQIRNYLLQQQSKILNVAALMLNGIAQASQILKPKPQ